MVLLMFLFSCGQKYVVLQGYCIYSAIGRGFLSLESLQIITVFDRFSALCAKLFQSGGKFFK